MSQFETEIVENLAKVPKNQQLQMDSQAFMQSSIAARYSYNWLWQGRPIIQYPQDMVAMQELIWAVKPDLIIETGIAHGGSLVMNASFLAMLEYAEAAAAGTMLNPREPKRKVLGIDIDIREHNRQAIEAHPLFSHIELLQGSSIDRAMITKVHDYAKDFKRIMVSLDSNHTHAHVLAELEAYAPLVSVGSYCVVFDSIIEDLPVGSYPDRPWDKGDNPKTALWQYLQDLDALRRQDATVPRFEIDQAMNNKLLITVAPDGYLQRIA